MSKRFDYLASARWWSVRLASNRKPSTYRCPLCGNHLPALSEHYLIMPEGNPDGRRHAHTSCISEARAGGDLVLHDEWRRTQPHGSFLQRFRHHWRALKSQ